MPSPVRRILEDRIDGIARELDALVVESQECARRESAEQLNQAVRRLRIAGDPEELCGTLEHAASQFAQNALVFRIEEGVARHERIEIPLSESPAFTDAVESREPRTFATAASQVPVALIGLPGHPTGGRASAFPIDAEDRVVALLYVSGRVQSAAVELLSQVTAIAWGSLVVPAPEEAATPPAPELVSIAPAPARASAATWESLSTEDQQLHLRAQRFARVQVAEMRLYESDAVQSGRARGDLYGALKKPIDAARQTYREQFFARCPNMVDYLHLELLRTLANDDSDLFGRDYPGPLV